MARSRLSRNFERRTKRRFYLTLLGIIFILFLLIKFGIPFIANFTLFITNIGGSQEPEKNSNKNSFIQSPILNPLPNATNSAYLVISGTAQYKQKVALYINNKRIEASDADKKGLFTFENIKLFSGENAIKLKAIQDSKSSGFSDEITVFYRDKPPSLSIESPENGKSFSKDENSVQVVGKTDPGSRITVNDFWAIVDEKGNFSYFFRLKDGENTIKVVATDEAGNKTEQERKVTYNP